VHRLATKHTAEWLSVLGESEVLVMFVTLVGECIVTTILKRHKIM